MAEFEQGAAPDDGTTVADDQQGTTGDPVRVEKEALYQTKYQETLKSQKELLDQLNTYQNTYCPIDTAPSQPQATPNQPQPQGDEYDIDLYDPNQFKNYIDSHLSQIKAGISTAAKEAILQARQQELVATEQREVFGKFDGWCKKNEIPSDLQQEAASEFQKRFDPAQTRPSVIVEWVSDYIVKRSQMAQTNMTAAQAAQEAAEKAKALAGVQQPAPGAPPSPTAQPGITPEQEAANLIAPDDDYVYGGA